MNSSWIERVTRNDSTSTATLETKSGASYNIHDMDANTFESWEGSESAGGYFNYFIRNQYEITKR